MNYYLLWIGWTFFITKKRIYEIDIYISWILKLPIDDKTIHIHTHIIEHLQDNVRKKYFTMATNKYTKRTRTDFILKFQTFISVVQSKYLSLPRTTDGNEKLFSNPFHSHSRFRSNFYFHSETHLLSTLINVST